MVTLNDKYKIHWMTSIYQDSLYDTRIYNYMKNLHSWYRQRKEKNRDDVLSHLSCKREIILYSRHISSDEKGEISSYVVMFEGHKEDLEKVLSSLQSD